MKNIKVVVTFVTLFQALSFNALGARVFAAETADKELSQVIESKNKAVEVFNRYLSLLQLRYHGDSGELAPNMVLKPGDVKNINTLSMQYFQNEPLTASSTAGTAENELKRFIKVLQAQMDQAKSNRESLAKMKDVHVDGEMDPALIHSPVITRLNGKAELLTNPTEKLDEKKTSEGHATIAKYEGFYYEFRTAKMGDRLKSGDVVRVEDSPNAGVRLVFNNGDHIEVGPGTAYKLSWSDNQKDQSTAHTDVDSETTTQSRLFYGKVRIKIKRGGIRRNLRVSTHAAVMGVRGTDFFLDDDAHKTDVIVMRGHVSIIPKKADLKPIEVSPGFTAEIQAPKLGDATIKNFDQVELDELSSLVGKAEERSKIARADQNRGSRRTSDNELSKVQSLGRPEPVIAATDPAGPKYDVPANAANEIRLEGKAFRMVMNDIVKDDPEFFAKIVRSKVTTIDQLNAMVVDHIKQGPEEKAAK